MITAQAAEAAGITDPRYDVAVLSLPVSGKPDMLEKFRAQFAALLNAANEKHYELVRPVVIGGMLALVFERYLSDEEANVAYQAGSRQSDLDDESRQRMIDAGLLLP